MVRSWDLIASPLRRGMDAGTNGGPGDGVAGAQPRLMPATYAEHAAFFGAAYRAAGSVRQECPWPGGFLLLRLLSCHGWEPARPREHRSGLPHVNVVVTFGWTLLDRRQLMWSGQATSRASRSSKTSPVSAVSPVGHDDIGCLIWPVPRSSGRDTVCVEESRYVLAHLGSGYLEFC